MNWRTICAGMAPILVLTGCGGSPDPVDQAEGVNSVATPVRVENASPVELPEKKTDVNQTVEGRPDLSPPALTAEAERGEKGARNVLLSFARAIELREFGQAWAMLSPADRRKWSKSQFSALFNDLGTITVAVPAGTIEGAAGSSFYSAAVTITANDKDGRPVRYEGEAMLRRANDVDGATPAQLRWHLEKLSLEWTH